MQPATRALLVVGILGLSVFSGPGGPAVAAPEESAGLPGVARLHTPDGGIQPQAVIDAAGAVHLIYYKGDPAAGDLYYTHLGANSTNFAPSIRVNNQEGSAIAMGSVRGGQLALGRGGRVHVAWNGSNGAQPRNPFGSSPMLYARIDAGRKAFEPQRNLMQRTSALDGGGTVAADPNGNVYVAWHGHSEDSAVGEAGRRVWIARSHDDGATFAPEEPVSSDETGACGCCGTRGCADGRGGIFILYRAAVGGSGRAMRLLASRDRGLHFDDRELDPWKIEACPMSTSAVAAGRDGVLVAWETSQKIAFARIRSPESPITTAMKPPGTGLRKHPALAENHRGEVILVWTEGTGWQKGGALAWQVFDATGQPTAACRRIERGVPVWGLPTVVARRDGSFLIIH
jgi:hypothetical protein